MGADDGRRVRQGVSESPLRPKTPDAERIYSHIRAHIAFEHMLVSVLLGTAVSAAALFAVNNVFSIAKGGWRLATLLSTGMAAVWFAFTAFLIGFAAVIAVVAPLFLALEKIRYRRLWPYLAAAALVQFAAYALIFGPPPLFEKPATFFIFAPGLLMAVLFWRRIQPLWRAAERETAAPPATVYRLH